MVAPILFLIFNRPDTTKLVFEQIAKAKPNKLYIAADGPRKGNNADIKFCNEARKITEKIDWDCSVKRLFRSENLGCKNAVISSLEWFFSNEAEGIILEDDCLPHPSFFDFSTKALEKYRLNTNVYMISGSNHLFNQISITTNSYVTKIFSAWGWATWKRSWNQFETDLGNEWRQITKDSSCIGSVQNYYRSVFKNFSPKSDTWDVQWSYSGLKNKLYSICSVNNLISNIGYLGSHSKAKHPFHSMPTASWERHKNFPNTMKENLLCDLADIINISNGRNSPVTRLFQLSKLFFSNQHS